MRHGCIYHVTGPSSLFGGQVSPEVQKVTSDSGLSLHMEEAWNSSCQKMRHLVLIYIYFPVQLDPTREGTTPFLGYPSSSSVVLGTEQMLKPVVPTFGY